MSFFITPMESFIHPKYGAGVRPKYVTELGVAWAVCRFGIQVGDPSISWANATPEQEASVGANADAVVVPVLDNTIGTGALTPVRNQIEAMSLPAQWVQTGMTYRTVLRVLVGMAQLMQRMRGLGQPVRLPGNLDRTIGSLSLAIRQALATAADQLGIDRTEITSSTTLREALRNAGQQFASGHGVALGDL